MKRKRRKRSLCDFDAHVSGKGIGDGNARWGYGAPDSQYQSPARRQYPSYLFQSGKFIRKKLQPLLTKGHVESSVREWKRIYVSLMPLNIGVGHGCGPLGDLNHAGV